jgi:hypothetical protein
MFGWTGNQARRPLRGAMVRKAADQVGFDYSAGATIAWDQEVYDTENFHDNVTNNGRLTVPAGCSFARLGLELTMANNTIGADITAIIRKNGTTSYDGCAQQSIDAPTAAPCINVTTGWVPVVAGDFFEATLFNVGDAAIDITAARSNFWIEAC